MRKFVLLALALVILQLMVHPAARADVVEESEQPGESLRMTMSSGAPNQYFFRGLLQSNKGFLWQSNSNLDVALYDSQAFKLIIPVGFWFSVHPGDKNRSVGKGPAAWYESRLSGGIAVEGEAYRADLRLVVYSSPNGSFEDVYELLLKADFLDDVIWTKARPNAVFRGFFPSVTLANELKGARDGRNSGLFAGIQLSPRFRLFSSPDFLIDAVIPLGVGLGLSDYYQLVDHGKARPTDHLLGYTSAGLLFDIVPRFMPVRLGSYSILPSLEVLLPNAAKDAQPHVGTVELVAKIDSALRF